MIKQQYQRIAERIHPDPHQRMMNIRFAINSTIMIVMIVLVFIGSMQERLSTIIPGILVISYMPFLVIDLYHRPWWTKLFLRWWLILTVLWWLLSIFDIHLLINVLWSAGFLLIGWMTWDYCYIIRSWKIRNIYNQVSVIGVFIIAVAFAVISMRRFQSINFSCQNISFLSSQFFREVTTVDPKKESSVKDAVVVWWRSSYLQLLDQWLKTDGSESLTNTIRQELRDWVITVMDQKKLYDNSICDYVTKALKDNYQKPSFFYSGVFLLTFIALPAAKLALLIIAWVFSLIVRWLYKLGVYRSKTTTIEHQMLE